MAGTRGYTTYAIPGFGGGLDLQSQPGGVEFSSAVDLLNTEFSETGAVRQRDGYARFTPLALTNQADSLGVFYKTDGTRMLLVGNGNRVDALDTNGQSVHNVSTSASPHSFARFGGPAGERIYMGNGTNQIRRYDTSGGFTTPAALSTVTGRYVGVWGNRLVVANQGGTTAGVNPSSVRFSEAGDPEDFDPNVFVDLHPGDGEQIMGMAVYGEQLIVFKQSKYFVFFSVGTDPQSNADPAWQPVESGVGLVAPRALATARDGVYFLARDGVYRTTGRAPEEVSGKIEPFFTGATSAFFTSDALSQAEIENAAMCFHQEKLYLAVTTGAEEANDRMLVHDPRYGWWSVWDIPATALASFRVGNRDELVFGHPGTNSYIGRHGPAYTADAGEMSITPGADVANYISNPSLETNATGWSSEAYAFTARDEFNQTAGALHGKTADTGGTWVTSGAGTDFAVEAVGHTVQRSTTDATRRFAIAGTTVFTATSVEAAVANADGLDLQAGVVARYVDTSNYVSFAKRAEGAISSSVAFDLDIMVAGATVYSDSLYVDPAGDGVTHTMRLTVTTSGTWTARVGGADVATGSHASLAPAGALDDGNAGLIDWGFGFPGTRVYDNFRAWVPIPSTTMTTARGTTEAKYDTASLSVTPVDAPDYGRAFYTVSSLAASLAYTGSVWVKASAAAAGYTVTVGLDELTVGSALVGSSTTTATLTTSWQSLSLSRTFGATGVKARVTVGASSVDPAHVIYIDGAQLEAAGAPSTYHDGTMVGYAWAGTPHASQTLSTVSSDAANAIVSRFRSGFTDMGDPNMKTVRETRVWGEGQSTFRLTTDYQDAGTSTTTTWSATDPNDVWTEEPTDVWTDDPQDTWGGTRQISPRLIRQARRGTYFSVELTNNQPGKTWAIHRMDLHIREKLSVTTVQRDAA